MPDNERKSLSRSASRSPAAPLQRSVSHSRSPVRSGGRSISRSASRKLSTSRSPRKISTSRSPSRKVSISRSPHGKRSTSRSPRRKVSESRSPRRKVSLSRSPQRSRSRSLSRGRSGRARDWRGQLERLYDRGEVRQSELDDTTLDALEDLSSELASCAVQRFSQANFSRINNKNGFFMGIIRRIKQDGGDQGGGDMESLPRSVRYKLLDLIDDRKIDREDVDGRICKALSELSVDMGLEAIDRYSIANLETIRSKTGFMMGIIKRIQGDARPPLRGGGYRGGGYDRYERDSGYNRGYDRYDRGYDRSYDRYDRGYDRDRYR